MLKLCQQRRCQQSLRDQPQDRHAGDWRNYSSKEPAAWRAQYSLTHVLVPESPRAILNDLEKIEKLFAEKANEAARANKNQKTFENVERLMVDRKEYLTNILRKKGAKMESLKNASATKHPCNLKHCDEQMYCIDEEIQNIDKILAGFESIRKVAKK